MRIKIFTIPILGNEPETSEMNRFLNTHKVMDVESGLVSGEKGNYWTFCIRYIERTEPIRKKTGKIDYRKILSEENFKTFSVLREIRKEIAKEDAIPAFAVFTDAEISSLAKQDEITIQSMKTINGLGEKKLEKYGNRVLTMLKEKLKNEKKGEPDTKDSRIG